MSVVYNGVVNDRPFDFVVRISLTVSLHQVFDTHLTKLVSLYQNNFSDGCRFLTVLISLYMLAQLGHNSTELEVKLAQITVGLELGTQLIVDLLSVEHRFIAIFHGRLTNAVILVEVVYISGTFGRD